MKLGIYCRISKAKDGNDLSIPDQKHKGIKKAKELGLPYELYIDEGISGASDKIEDRPEFARFIADISNGTLSAVYAYDQSRFERNPQVRFLINQIFKKTNITYYTELDGLVDLNDPQAEFFGDLLSVINKYHVTLTKIKVKSALKTRVESGKAHSILPYGYKKDESGTLIVDEEESDIIKKIYDLSLSGMGTRSIANFLNDNGVLTRYNKIQTGTISTKNKFTGTVTVTDKKDIKWAGNTIRNIIKNTIYKGERVYSQEIYKVPEIINSTKWEKAQKNLESNRNNSGKKVVHRYLLKGLLRCGICGRNMYGRSRVNKHDNYYMCSSKRIKGENCRNRSINIDKIEAFIWDRFFKGDDFLNRIRKEFTRDDTKLVELKKQIETLEHKLSTFENEKNRAIELVVKGTLSEKDVKSVINKTNKAIDETKGLLLEHSHRLHLIENNTTIIEKYTDEFVHFTTNTTFQQKKKIINDFIENIEVKFDDFLGSYEITVHFKVAIDKETYHTFNNFTNILHDADFILPRTINENKFKIPPVLIIDGSKGVEMLGGDDSVPYRVYNDGFMEKVFNTRVPYGDVDQWSEDEIEYFFENNPDWYCKESGVSLWSKNTEIESYNVAKSEYQKELAKKNNHTPSLDTISSEIV
ncbi:MAG: recombinase family protein [Bacteroidales bacterium]